MNSIYNLEDEEYKPFPSWNIEKAKELIKLEWNRYIGEDKEKLIKAFYYLLKAKLNLNKEEIKKVISEIQIELKEKEEDCKKEIEIVDGINEEQISMEGIYKEFKDLELEYLFNELKWILDYYANTEIVLEEIENEIGERQKVKSIGISNDGEIIITTFNKNNTIRISKANININNITLYEEENKEIKIRDKRTGRLYSLKDFLNEKKIRKHAEEIVKLFESNKIPKEKLKRFSIYLNEDGYYSVPNKEILFFENDVEKEIEKHFSIEYNEEEAKKELKEIYKILTPKQKIDFSLILGIPLINLLKQTFSQNLNKTYMLLHGQSRTGKTTLTKMALKFWWGSEYNVSGDTLTSEFRLNSILTINLPILIDDADAIKKNTILNRIKDSTMGIPSFRGKSDLSIKSYTSKSTLIMTSNRNILLEKSIKDITALYNRFWINYYDLNDVIKGSRDVFEGIKTKGFVFDLFKKVKAKELWDLYKSYLEKEDNEIKAILLFTFTILKKYCRVEREELQDIEIEREENEELINHYEWIVRDAEKGEKGEDYEGKDLKDFIFFKTFERREKEGEKYIAITRNYLSHVNSNKRHPLYGKYTTLKDFKNLYPILLNKNIEETNIKTEDGKEVWAILIPYEDINTTKNQASYTKMACDTLNEVYGVESKENKEVEEKKEVEKEEEEKEKEEDTNIYLPEYGKNKIDAIIESIKEKAITFKNTDVNRVIEIGVKHGIVFNISEVYEIIAKMKEMGLIYINPSDGCYYFKEGENANK
jgi:hypothetical protein